MNVMIMNQLVVNVNQSYAGSMKCSYRRRLNSYITNILKLLLNKKIYIHETFNIHLIKMIMLDLNSLLSSREDSLV